MSQNGRYSESLNLVSPCLGVAMGHFPDWGSRATRVLRVLLEKAGEVMRKTI